MSIPRSASISGVGVRVARDVDARAADGDDVTAVLAFFRMELQVSLRRVVGCHSFDSHPVARRNDAPRPHYVAVRVERFGRRAIAYDVGRARCERVDRLAVQMVVVRVGYQNQIGFGQSCVIGIGVYGVDVDRPALACRDGECGVFENVNVSSRPSRATMVSVG